MEYDDWVRKFKEVLGHNIEKELTAEVDDNIRRGFLKPELHWKPLSPKYKKRKEKEGRNLKGLMYHGALLKATDSKVKVNSKGLQVKVFNNMIYAGVHEYGSKKKGIPKRPFVKPALEKIENELPRIIEKTLRKM